MRYMGGKFRIRKQLGELINKNLGGRGYYEPFMNFGPKKYLPISL